MRNSTRRRARHSQRIRPALLFVSSGLALLGAGACGSGAAAPPSAGTGSRSGRPAKVESLEPKRLGESEFGALHGLVRLAGEPPVRFALGSGKRTECKAHDDVEHLSDIVIAENGLLADVLVRVTRGYDADSIPAPPRQPAVLDQRGCTYTPHVLAIQAGQGLEVRNSDPTTHNVNGKAKRNPSPGNRNMGQGQSPLFVELPEPELKLRFKCDIHPWMEAWVHVVEHPWFDVSARDGSFEINGLAPGKYSVEFLHIELGRQTARDIEVEAGRSTGFAITFEP